MKFLIMGSISIKKVKGTLGIEDGSRPSGKHEMQLRNFTQRNLSNWKMFHFRLKELKHLKYMFISN